MPIEIKELTIRAVVGERSAQTAAPITGQTEDIKQFKKEIINEVTYRILRMLRKKSER